MRLFAKRGTPQVGFNASDRAQWVTPPFDRSLCDTPPDTSNPTIVTVFRAGAFKRLVVTYIYKGTATISWEMERNFCDPGPYTFQLQGSHAGTPRADDWFNIGATTSNFFATDDNGTTHQRMYGKTPTLHYRVTLNTPLGCYISSIANILGTFNKHDWLIVREILRQEQLNHKIFSSVKGYLYKARRYGPECADCRNRGSGESTIRVPNLSNLRLDDEIINTNCRTCYGTGFEQGYYPGTEYYALLDPENTREHRDLQGNKGTDKPVVIKARFLATLPLIQGDAWVNVGSDERYYVHNVTEGAVWKSVPVVYQVELRLAPFTDALYSVPAPPTAAPITC